MIVWKILVGRKEILTTTTAAGCGAVPTKSQREIILPRCVGRGTCLVRVALSDSFEGGDCHHHRGREEERYSHPRLRCSLVVLPSSDNIIIIIIMLVVVQCLC